MPMRYFKTRILAGGRIEFQDPRLIEGQEVTISIFVPEENTQGKKSLEENLAAYSGGQLFKTAAEVDAYIREERDSWGD